MVKSPEFYIEKQGRPDSKKAMDMETNRSVGVDRTYLSALRLGSITITYEGDVVCKDGSIVYKSR